jgi:peptidoglycan/xylan/chitin deacetylase (PgdA/CDA1 family)
VTAIRLLPPREWLETSIPTDHSMSNSLLSRLLTFSTNSGQELIVNLHGIGTPHSDVAPGESIFWINKNSFVNILDLIVAARSRSDLSIGITFDDGNMSDVEIALPELVKRGLSASFFICAGRIGAPHYLDRNALADLLAAGMEVGSHGMDHRNWRELDETMLETEVGTARRCIEDACGTTVKKVAIPFGSYDRRVLRRLRREAFESVYTSDRGLTRSKAWLKARNTINSGWLEADIRTLLIAKPSLKARLRQNAAILYKQLS